MNIAALIQNAIARYRIKAAEFIAPERRSQLGTSRFVAVRFFAPGLTMVEVYDRERKGDVAAWRENQALYPCQLIAQAAELGALMGDSHLVTGAAA